MRYSHANDATKREMVHGRRVGLLRVWFQQLGKTAGARCEARGTRCEQRECRIVPVSMAKIDDEKAGGSGPTFFRERLSKVNGKVLEIN